MPTYLGDTLQRGQSGAGAFPVAIEGDLRVSSVLVSDYASLSNIPSWKLMPKMLAYSIADDKNYRLELDLVTWTEVITTDPNALVHDDVFDSNGYIKPGLIQNLFINDSFVVDSEAAMLALTTVTGNAVIRTDSGQVFIKLNNNDPSILADFADITGNTGAVTSVNGQTGAVNITIANLLSVPQNVTDFNTAVAASASVTTLISSVATLQGQYTSLSGNVTTLSTSVASNTTDITTLQSAVTALQGNPVIPSLTGNATKYLTTPDGINLAWSNASGLLPSQAGQIGKFLTTDGTNAYWTTVSTGGGTWGTITGTLSDQTDLQSALDGKENTITSGTNLQYWRGDKTFQTLNTSIVPELTNLYYTDTRVRATVLTGLTISGSTITATDTVLQAFGKLQNQVTAAWVIGGNTLSANQIFGDISATGFALDIRVKNATRYLISATGDHTFSNVTASSGTPTGFTFTQAANTGGNPKGLLYTAGAHTGLATALEGIDLDFNLARTVNRVGGNYTNQRAVIFRAPTYTFTTTTTIGGVTATVYIDAAPTVTGPSVASLPVALYVAAGVSYFNGSVVGVGPNIMSNPGPFALTINGNWTGINGAGKMIMSGTQTFSTTASDLMYGFGNIINWTYAGATQKSIGYNSAMVFGNSLTSNSGSASSIRIVDNFTTLGSIGSPNYTAIEIAPTLSLSLTGTTTLTALLYKPVETFSSGTFVHYGLIIDSTTALSGFGTGTPTARVHIAAGTSAAGRSPLKFTPGVFNQTTFEAGAINYDGTNLSLSDATRSYTILKGLSASATLDFPNTAAQTSSDLTISLTGALVGEEVILGIPFGSINNDSGWCAFVSASDVVTVRFLNLSIGAINPASGTFRVTVIKR